MLPLLTTRLRTWLASHTVTASSWGRATCITVSQLCSRRSLRSRSSQSNSVGCQCGPEPLSSGWLMVGPAPRWQAVKPTLATESASPCKGNRRPARIGWGQLASHPAYPTHKNIQKGRKGLQVEGKSQLAPIVQQLDLNIPIYRLRNVAYSSKLKRHFASQPLGVLHMSSNKSDEYEGLF